MSKENTQPIEIESNFVIVDQNEIELDGSDTGNDNEDGKIL
jgi:hypothetical protein